MYWGFPMTYFSRPYKILFIGHFYILPPLKLAFSRAQMSHAFFANPSIQFLLFTVNPHKNYISLLFLPKFLASHSHPFTGQHLFPETLHTINHYILHKTIIFLHIGKPDIFGGPTTLTKIAARREVLEKNFKIHLLQILKNQAKRHDLSFDSRL